MVCPFFRILCPCVLMPKKIVCGTLYGTSEKPGWEVSRTLSSNEKDWCSPILYPESLLPGWRDWKKHFRVIFQREVSNLMSWRIWSDATQDNYRYQATVNHQYACNQMMSPSPPPGNAVVRLALFRVSPSSINNHGKMNHFVFVASAWVGGLKMRSKRGPQRSLCRSHAVNQARNWEVFLGTLQ